MYETDSIRWWWVLAIMPLHLTLNDRKLLTIVSNDFQKRLLLHATVIDARSFNVSVSQQESFEKQSKTLELGTRTDAATLANYCEKQPTTFAEDDNVCIQTDNKDSKESQGQT